MTACTPKEETEWRSRLDRPEEADAPETAESAPYSTVIFDIKSLGAVFGKPGNKSPFSGFSSCLGTYKVSSGTVARRVSIHRATTVGAKSPLCQVILKNTSTQKDMSSSISKRPLNRSKSLMTHTSRAPVLAPSRGERTRLESLLSDVWSRNILPFPGITSRYKSEHLVRNSATTMMRKLSVANITSSLGKRSMSVPNAAKANDDTQSHNVLDTSDVKNSDRSSCASVIDEVVDSNKGPPSPSIGNGSEGNGSPRLAPYQGDGDTLSGTVRKVDLSKLDVPWNTEDDGLDGPPSRTPTGYSNPTNGQPPPSLKSQSSMGSISLGKENALEKCSKHGRFLQSPLSGVKSARKWSKAGGINKGGVASSLRSFFR